MKRQMISLVLLLSSCGLPSKPHLDRRDSHSVGSDGGADAEPEMSAEEKAEKEAEDIGVLNATMKERYLSARGVDLRTGRAALAPGIESATLRSFASLVGKLAWAFGKTVAEIPLTDASSFTISKPLQNDSANYGASGYRLFATAAVGLCKGLIAANAAKFAAAPVQASLATQCNEWSERFWFRSMAAPELAICMNTGLEVTKTTTSVQERWSQICSVIVSAPQFVIVDAPQTATPSTGGTSPTPTTPPPASVLVGVAATGRQLFTASCSGCHGANRPVRARTEAALQTASANMIHIGREACFLPPKVPTPTPTEFHHILAYLKSLGA